MLHTKIGLRYNAVGENPNAVDAQGISVIKYQ
jgi:simple sugar transport system permease protein